MGRPRMLVELGDVLHDAGLPVVEVPGARTRGHGLMDDPLGILCHHTAGPDATSKSGRDGGLWPRPPAPPRLHVPGYPSLAVVVDGRPGLDGPLSQLGLARSGVWVFIAAGQAWHAGTGGVPWCPSGGNRRLIGVEAESVGTRDDWTAEQRESYPRGVAALAEHFGIPTSHVIGHKEWAPARKIDPAFVDMSRFRSAVQVWRDRPRPAPTPAPAPARPPAAPVLMQEDAQMQVNFTVGADGVFREAVKVEAGGHGTPIADSALLTLSSFLGATSYVLTVWMAEGNPYRPADWWSDFECAEGQNIPVTLPTGSRMVTIEGRSAQGARPVASVWHLRDDQ